MANTAEDWATNEIATVSNLFCDTRRAMLNATKDPLLKEYSADILRAVKKLGMARDDFLIAVGFGAIVDDEKKLKREDVLRRLDKAIEVVLDSATYFDETGVKENEDFAQELMTAARDLQFIGKVISEDAAQ